MNLLDRWPVLWRQAMNAIVSVTTLKNAERLTGLVMIVTLLAAASRRRNHGNGTDGNASAFTSVHTRECDSKGAPRRRWLEHSRPGESSSVVRDRLTMEEPIGVRQRAGKTKIIAFLSRKWAKTRMGVDRLIKELWTFTGSWSLRESASLMTWHGRLRSHVVSFFKSGFMRIWEFNDDFAQGLTVLRNEMEKHLPTLEGWDQQYLKENGEELKTCGDPEDHPGLSDLGLS